MPYEIVKHPSQYKYKVCKKAKTSKKKMGKSKGKSKSSGKSRNKSTKMKIWNKTRKCFSKKWLTKKRAKAQRTAITLSELGLSRRG